MYAAVRPPLETFLGFFADRIRELRKAPVEGDFLSDLIEMPDADHAVFDVETGKEIWKAQLPSSGGATPMTYQTRKGGKQFVVIAAGGHRAVTEEPQDDSIVAFTLP